MNANRLSDTLAAALNLQMTKEAHASQVYLSYAAWSEHQGFSGIAEYLFRHAQEERNHMMKLLQYILKRGGEVLIQAIPAPHALPTSISMCFEKIFEHEVENTRNIYAVAKMSFDEQDWATWDFMQWFVKEQVEEETMAMGLINKIALATAKNGGGVYSLDRDMKSAIEDDSPAEEATA